MEDNKIMVFKKLKKKAQSLGIGGANSLIMWSIAFAVIAVSAIVGVSIIEDTQDDIAECNTGFTLNKSATPYQCYNSSGTRVAVANLGYNVSANLLDAEDNLTQRTPLLGTVVIFGVILIVVAAFLGVFMFARNR